MGLQVHGFSLPLSPFPATPFYRKYHIENVRDVRAWKKKKEIIAASVKHSQSTAGRKKPWDSERLGKQPHSWEFEWIKSLAVLLLRGGSHHENTVISPLWYFPHMPLQFPASPFLGSVPRATTTCGPSCSTFSLLRVDVFRSHTEEGENSDLILGGNTPCEGPELSILKWRINFNEYFLTRFLSLLSILQDFYYLFRI